MKHLKEFLNTESDVNYYYKIIIDGSFDKFLIALDKLGIKDEVFKDWDITCFDDIAPETKKDLKNKSICLAIYKVYFSKNVQYCVRRKLVDFAYQIEELVKYNYKGEITVEDYEVDVKKYNL